MSTENTGHEYDGILEHDNRLPRWWLFTLYAAIVFAFAYWLYYQTFDIGLQPRAQYELDVRAAQEVQAKRAAQAGVVTDEALEKMTGDPAIVASGQAVYVASCLPCHGDKGQGLVGPNMTDDFFVHGAKPTDNLKIIAEGFAPKGMPAWQPVLGPTKVRDVAVYLLTLRGTHAVGKPPEGVDVAGKPPP